MISALTTVGLSRSVATANAARPALIGGGDREPVTYGQLQRTVDALATAILRSGARVGDRVAIWMAKGPSYAEAILATLQAGCAYVPLDAAQPKDRAAHILADSAPLLVIVDEEHTHQLPAGMRPIVIRNETLTGKAVWDESRSGGTGPWSGFGGDAVDDFPVVTPDDLAAILYTSGSTGVPKGVMISHRNLTTFVGWACEELEIGPDDVFANHASFNFDLSTFDLFAALSVGAAVWIIEDRQTRDVAALSRGILEHGVTVWYSVPSILNLLTASGALTSDICRSLRYVLFAGEPFPIGQLRELAERLRPATSLYNLYGPTETNVCTYYRVRRQDLVRSSPVPIGGPVGNAKLSVLDEDGFEVTGPDGVGELVVEGDCVTPGYWRREDEPAALHHRNHRHPTGDLVSYEQGRLVYRGRKDRMVKLRGYRIELGEVEAAVLRHAAVAEAAVTVEGEGSDAKLVVAYTLREGAGKPGLIELKRHVASFLPPYMVPQRAVHLESLPRNANGKIDYRKLAENPWGAS